MFLRFLSVIRASLPTHWPTASLTPKTISGKDVHVPIVKPVSSRPSEFGKNQSIANAVLDYCSFPYAQRYAIMLDGKWGSGKTHLIEALLKILDEQFVPDERNRPLYVSLYGVTDAAAIGEQLYQQLHPLLSSKGMRLASAVMRGLLRTTVKIDLSELHKGDLSLGSQLPDVKVSELLGGAKSRVIIFDDFERAKMNPIEVLGYINPLVEHDGCKVIILANEEEITDREEYERRKEKTVGQTFVVVPDVETAFTTFLLEIDNATLSEFLATNRDKIVQVFTDSGLGNLRLLKQFLWDFEHLYTILDDRYRQSEEAILRICNFLLASSLELRSRRIALQEFGMPHISVFMKRRQAEKEGADLAVRQMDNVAKQYPTVDFTGEMITFDTAVQMITKSVYDMPEIHRQLNAHPLFTPVQSLPSWRALWFAHDQPESEVDLIVSRFTGDFEEKRDYEENEIPHVLGLSLWLADIDQPGWNISDIESRLKRFIDKAYDNRPVKANEAASSFHIDYTMNGAMGLSYKQHNDLRFKTLCQYLEAKAISWREECEPEAASNLLAMISKGEIEQFSRETYLTPEGGRGLYVDVPVLRLISLDQFIPAFGQLLPLERRRLLKALHLRYDHLYIFRRLLDEENWIAELKQRLLEYANNLTPIPADSLRLDLRNYLDQLSEKFAATKRSIEQENASS